MSAPSRLHIMAVLDSLGGGGAERVMSLLTGSFAERGHRVTLVTIQSARNDRYPVPPGVTRIALDAGNESRGMFDAVVANRRRIMTLRETMTDTAPDVILSFLTATNVTVLLAARGTGIPVVVSERTNPEACRLSTAWELARRATYRKAAAVVVQTEPLRAWASGIAGTTRAQVIANPSRALPAGAVPREHRVVVVGRLVGTKRVDLVIRAFAQTRIAHQGWTLDIVGDGPERHALQSLAATLLPAPAVHFHGYRQPDELLCAASIYASASELEGFPMAQLEAMSAGCAIVATDCPHGPRTLLEQSQAGILVPMGDVNALAAALQQLASDDTARRRAGEAAMREAQRYALPVIVGEWESLFARVAGTPRGRRAA